MLRLGADGKPTLLGVEIPPDLSEADPARHLDDLMREDAQPGEDIRIVESD